MGERFDVESSSTSAPRPQVFWLSIARASALLTARRWRGVRFLCYHSVVPPDELPGLSQVTPVLSEDGFRNHLAWIRRNGYVVVSMADARRLLRNGDAARAQFASSR